jgi:hypothetical protein
MHAARAEGARLVLGAEIVAIETSGGDADLGTYFRPEPGGGLLVGG